MSGHVMSHPVRMAIKTLHFMLAHILHGNVVQILHTATAGKHSDWPDTVSYKQ